MNFVCKITVSGGFAVVQPNSTLSINAVEAYPIEEFSIEVILSWKKRGTEGDGMMAKSNSLQAVRNQLAEANKIANGSGSELDISEAKIEVEVSI